MATTKEVKVVINGEEYVSVAAKSAEKGMDSFTGRIGGWFKSFVDLKAAWDFVAQAAGKVRQVVVDSFAAYDELQTSQRKLEGTAKLTGLSLEYLQSVAEKGRREFGLSRVSANDFAVEVAKLERASGGAASASDLLNGFLNIGAARGLTAAQSMQAASQALLGIDEGTDKLFGKNPSGLWADFEGVIGKTASTFSDTDKMAALAYATIDGGSKTVGEYQKFLNSAQGSQAQFNQRLQESQATLGESLQPLRALALEGLGGLLEYLGKSQASMDSWVATLAALLRSTTAVLRPFIVAFSFAFDSVGVALERSMIEIRRWAYGLTNGLGVVLRAFGIEFGDRLINEAQSKFFKLNEDHEAFRNRLTAIASKWRGDEIAAEKTAANTIVATAKTKAREIEQSAKDMSAVLEANIGGPMRISIGLTEQSIRSLADAANAQLPPESAAKFVAHMTTLAARAREVEARFTATAPEVEKGSKSAQDMANEIATVARGAIDAAQAFGVIDSTAASALNSAVNIAGAIGQIAGGNVFAGVPGLLGGVANIVNVMVGGDRERRLTMQKNTQRIEELTSEIGNLDLNITGDDFNQAKDVLGKIVPLIKGPTNTDFSQIVRILGESGMTLGDLSRIADELGINIKNSNGSINLQTLPQLLQALGLVEFGQFGNDFASQLRSTRAGFDINGVSEIGQIGQLAGLGGQFSSALQGVFDANDLAGSRSRLQALFTRLQNGGVSAAELGGLTGSQFLELITDLISRIDNLSGDGGTGDTGGGTGGGDTGTGGGGGSGGTGGDVGGVAFATLQTVVDTIAAQSEAAGTYYEASLGYQQRIADATEATATNTSEALQYLSILPQIAENLGIDTISAKIEDQRRQSLLAVGQFPTVR